MSVLMLKHVLIVFLLLYVSMGAKASENLSDHEVFCMKTDQDCLTYIQSRLLNTQKNSSNWYKLKTYEFDYYFDYQKFDNLHSALSPFVDQEELPGAFKIQVYFYYAKSLNYLGDKQQAKAYAAKAFAQLDEIYNVFGDPLRLVELANLQHIFGDKKKALRVLLDAEKRYAKSSDAIFHFELHINKGHIYYNWQQYPQAIESNLKAYNAIKRTKHHAKTVIALGNLAFSYFKHNDFNNAVKYYKTAFDYIEPDSIYQATYSLRLAQSYWELGNKTQAALWLNKIDITNVEFSKSHAKVYDEIKSKI